MYLQQLQSFCGIDIALSESKSPTCIDFQFEIPAYGSKAVEMILAYDMLMRIMRTAHQHGKEFDQEYSIITKQASKSIRRTLNFVKQWPRSNMEVTRNDIMENNEKAKVAQELMKPFVKQLNESVLSGKQRPRFGMSTNKNIKKP